MTLLKKPKLGTDPTAWRYYSVHMLATYVMKETMLVANYKRCIKLAFAHSEEVQKMLDIAEERGIKSNRREQIIASAEGLTKWAKGLKNEGYHEVYVHSFISLWSSFEAGIENIVSDYLKNDKSSAIEIVKQLESKKFTMETWPWSTENCLWAASLAERQAISKTANGGYDLFKRLQTLFSWIGIDIEIDRQKGDALAEAKLIRDVLLHRNGEVGPKDASKCPALKSFVGTVVPIDEARFKRYASAVSITLVSILHGAASKEKQERGN